MSISEVRPTRYAWTQEGGLLRLSFDPVGTVEAVGRVDFNPNKNLTGDEELFPDFDTENVAWAYVLEMIKAALLQQRIMMLHPVRDAAEIQGLERKLLMLLGNGKVTGTLKRERQTLNIKLLERDGMSRVMHSPYLKASQGYRDYGETS